jgi:hypothetical protein
MFTEAHSWILVIWSLSTTLCFLHFNYFVSLARFPKWSLSSHQFSYHSCFTVGSPQIQWYMIIYIICFLQQVSAEIPSGRIQVYFNLKAIVTAVYVLHN